MNSSSRAQPFCADLFMDSAMSAVSIRDTADMTELEWRALPDSLKLKYAALYPDESLNLISPTSLDTYAGTDMYFFKTDRIRHRVTLSPGDSQNRFRNWDVEAGDVKKLSAGL